MNHAVDSRFYVPPFLLLLLLLALKIQYSFRIILFIYNS